MFSRIVTCHDHKRSTGNDAAGLGYLILSSTIHPQRYVNKMDYYDRLMYSSWLPAILQRIKRTLKENYV